MNGIQTEEKLVQIKGTVSAYWNTLTDNLWDAIIADQQQETYMDDTQVTYLTVPKTAGMQFEAAQKDQKDKKDDKGKGDKDNKDDKDNKGDKDQRDRKGQKGG